MPGLAPRDAAVARDIASSWLAGFGSAIENSDWTGAAALFEPEGHWRDILALTWHFSNFRCRDKIGEALPTAVKKTRPRGFALDDGRTAPRYVTRSGVDVVEAIFRFETKDGTGSGVLRIKADGKSSGDAQAWHILTSLNELNGFEWGTGRDSSSQAAYARDFTSENWLDRRKTSGSYADRDPDVIVVGAGHAGLTIAARLGHLGIDALIVDRMVRIGDNWRQRYHSLTLHNQTPVNHLPFLPFPATWPKYLPKDKLAGWLEYYAEAMELNVWLQTDFVSATFDDDAGCWHAILRKADGTNRVMHPRHVVLATGGVSGTPFIPATPGLGEFRGVVIHSSEFKSGSEWRGRNAVIVGTGNSGHDVAQDLFSHGAHTTMVQRNPTNVLSVEPSSQLLFRLYTENIPTEDSDLLSIATPYPEFLRGHKIVTQEMKRLDRDLLEGLATAGFKTDLGEDDAGFQIQYLKRGGGYYLNVGCSDLIVQGKVKILQYAAIETLSSDGIVLRDGTKILADLIVMATGYKSQTDLVRALFGDVVANRVGPVWGLDDEGEVLNMWKRTKQEGLWFIAGSLAQCRVFSKMLSMQIKACEMGLISKSAPSPDDASTVVSSMKLAIPRR